MSEVLSVKYWRRMLRLPAVAMVVAGASSIASATPPGMNAVDLVELPRLASPRISPGGRYVLYLRSQVDWQANKQIDRFQLVDTWKSETLPTPEPADAEEDFNAAVWAPDGHRFVFTAKRDDDEHKQAYLYDLQDGATTRLTGHPANVKAIIWAPDGAGFYFQANAVRDDELTELLDGNWIIEEYESHRAEEIWYFDLESNQASRIIAGDFSVRNYSLSRDGEQILYSRLAEGLVESQYSELWTYHVDTGLSRQHTDNGYVESRAELAPDGRSFAYIASVNGAGEQYYEDNLFVQRIGDAPPELMLPDLAMEIGDLHWDQSGQGLFVLGNTGLRTHIYHYEIQTKKLEQLTHGDAVIDGWSYDVSSDSHVFRRGSAEYPGEVFTLGDSSGPQQVSNEHSQLSERFTLPRQTAFAWRGRDGAELQGLLIYPLDFDENQRFPLATITHGGPRSSAQFGSWNMSRYVAVLAGQGYGVFLPNHRGGAGYGDAFLRDMVGQYFRNAHLDVLDGIDALIDAGRVDADQLIKMGWSAGGHMTNKIITVSDRFQAASSGAGVADWVSLYGESDARHNRTVWFGGAPWEENAPLQSFMAQSILKDAWRIKTPTLFFVGERDVRVPPTQAIMMYRGAKAAGAEVELYIAPDEPHNFGSPSHRLFKINKELQWFAKHLGRATYTPVYPQLDAQQPDVVEAN